MAQHLTMICPEPETETVMPESKRYLMLLKNSNVNLKILEQMGSI